MGEARADSVDDLARRARQGDSQAAAQLLALLRPFFASVVAATPYVPGYERGDLLQECRLCAWRKLAAWDPERGSLCVFLGKVLRNRMNDLIAAENAQCRTVLNRAALQTEWDEDFAAPPAPKLPERAERALTLASPEQRRILFLLGEGCSKQEVANRLYGGDFKVVKREMVRFHRAIRKAGLAG
jgi:DNA-directed RNA polymerase specialized sigma24 family protein